MVAAYMKSELFEEQKRVLKSVGPKIVPFLKTVAVFLVLFGETSSVTFFCMMIKCLPVLMLIHFVLLDGVNMTEAYAYTRKIFIGLIFSVIGDALLVWELFEFGLLSFAIGHVFYTLAFGFKPRDYKKLLLSIVVGTLAYAYIAPGVKGILIYLVPLYIALIFAMTWRAGARVGKLSRWTKQCSCAGALLFCISDFTIAVNKFAHPVPYSHTIIMSTYYAAQMLIALSVVDSQVDAVLEQSLKAVQ